MSDGAERLRRRAAAYADSALVQAMRASGRAFQAPPSGRLLGRLARLPLVSVRVGRRLAAAVAEDGLRAAAAKVRRQLRRQLATARVRVPAGLPPARLPAPAVLAPRVLIIAELSIPQCAKYRVWQKQEHFRLLGTECTVLPWPDIEACGSALQSNALVIFYRVPGHASVLALIREAGTLGLPTFWEADDLIFDVEEYRRNANLRTLPRRMQQELLDGVALYRAAMLACERTIASTGELAEAMQEAGAGPSAVVENALDAETLRAAEALRARTRRTGNVWIVYGSGTKTHDADFAVAAPALAAVMQQRPEVRLRIIGELTLHAALEPYLDRIERLPAVPYFRYLELMAEADIAVAPLENSRFNDAKSNIKYLEASALGLPSVCSGRASFRTVIRNAENGFLAEGEAAWRKAVLALVDDPGLRRTIGEAAHRDVLARYAPRAVAEAQLVPLVAGLDRRPAGRFRVLSVNIYFAPTSFGGATVVAEEMARRLHARDDTDVFVFTSAGDQGPPYTLRRYDWDGLPVLAVRLPAEDPVEEFDDPEMARVFADVLRAAEPQVVHFHCLPRLGAGLLRVCQEMGIPYVVTVHDAWWLCARQFMVTGRGDYCFQTTIDVGVCQACIPGARFLRERFGMLQQGLEEAALVLSPSEAHRQLHLANGLDPGRVVANRNGVRMPAAPRQRRPGGELRFGYVGGRPAIKGYDLIREAFRRIEASNYTLVLVDNSAALGFSSMNAAEWRVHGRVEVVPPYRQDEVDAFFETIDVLLFPSQWKESFGLIVAEALARDVWVILTEGAGVGEFVVDGENGTVIPIVNNPAPLQRAIEALLRDPMRLSDYRNPHKGRLRGYGEQAEELYALLRRAGSEIGR